MSDDGFFLSGLYLVLKCFRKGKDMVAGHRRQRFRDDGIAFRDLEAEVEVFGLVGFVEQRLRDKGAVAVVDDADYRLETAVVQSSGFQGAFQGAEEIVAVGEQIRLVKLHADEGTGRGVEKGKRKTTQCALDGHSVLR